MDDDSTFEALDATSDDTVGPPGVLVIGYERVDGARIEQLLHSIGAAGHRVVCCTTTMGNWTVAQALQGDDGGTLLPVGKVPAVVLLSGMTDRMVEQVLDALRATELARPIFAVATPTNLEFTVVQLLEDLLAERQAQE